MCSQWYFSQSSPNYCELIIQNISSFAAALNSLTSSSWPDELLTKFNINFFYNFKNDVNCINNKQKRGQQNARLWLNCFGIAELSGETGREFHTLCEEEITEILPRNIGKSSKNTTYSTNGNCYLTTVCWNKLQRNRSMLWRRQPDIYRFRSVRNHFLWWKYSEW